MESSVTTDMRPAEAGPERPPGGYSLLLCGLPIGCTPAKIREFFFPIILQNCTVTYLKHDAPSAIVDLASKEDVDVAMREKQWQYIDGCSVRLRDVDEFELARRQSKWDFIHRDLQTDILSHFNIFLRCRFRRVCQQWNDFLTPLWDQVNNCIHIYLDDGEHDPVLVLKKVFHRLSRQVGDCGRVTCLVVQYAPYAWIDGSGLGSTWHYADQVFPPSVIDRYLLKHDHIQTLILIGTLMHDCEWAENIVLFNDRPLWPRAMRVVFHDCQFDLPLYFPQQDAHKLFSANGSVDNYYTTVRVANLVMEVGPEVDALARYRQLHAQVDQQRLLWPASLPSEQLEWLKAQLAHCALEEDVTDNKEPVSEQEPLSEEPFSDPLPDPPAAAAAVGWSYRQVISRYLKLYDSLPRLVQKPQATGIFFGDVELSWRDVHVLARVFSERPGGQAPPYKMTDYFAYLDFYYNSGCLIPKKAATKERATFKRQLKGLLKDGPKHHKFWPMVPADQQVSIPDWLFQLPGS